MSDKWMSSCPEPEIEDGPYPTDEWLEKLEHWEPESFHDARVFFTNDLQYIFEILLWPYGCAKCVEDKDGSVHLYLSTGGWSGCESVLGAMVASGVKGIGLYWRMWNEATRRGGAYWWVIPGVKND